VKTVSADAIRSREKKVQSAAGPYNRSWVSLAAHLLGRHVRLFADMSGCLSDESLEAPSRSK